MVGSSHVMCSFAAMKLNISVIVKHSMLLHTSLQGFRKNINQKLHPKRRTITELGQTVSFVNVLEKIDRVKTDPHCMFINRCFQRCSFKSCFRVNDQCNSFCFNVVTGRLGNKSKIKMTPIFYSNLLICLYGHSRKHICSSNVLWDSVISTLEENNPKLDIHLVLSDTCFPTFHSSVGSLFPFKKFNFQICVLSPNFHFSQYFSDKSIPACNSPVRQK